jgi:hypothetical protein
VTLLSQPESKTLTSLQQRSQSVKYNCVRCPTLQSHISSMKKLQGKGSPCLYWPVSDDAYFLAEGGFDLVLGPITTEP